MKNFFTSKAFYGTAVGVFLIGTVALGVHQCASDKNDTPTDSTSLTVVNVAANTPFTADVTQITAMDRQQMYTVSENYNWFETNVKLAGTVDTLVTPDVEFIANIFQTSTEVPGGGYFTTVYCTRHTATSNETEVKKDAFWLEDNDLNTADGEYLPFSTIFQKLKESNCVQPKSQYVTLRKQVGPKAANPQWIFGNDNRGIVWVDAFTGEVSTKNPAF